MMNTQEYLEKTKVPSRSEFCRCYVWSQAVVGGGGTQYSTKEQLLGFFLEHIGQKLGTSSLIPPSTSSARAIQSPGSA